MDPVSLAFVTSAVSTMAVEYLKGGLDEAGKETYHKIKRIFGLEAGPPAADESSKIEQALQAAPDKGQEVKNLLDAASPTSPVGQIVIHAKNVGAGIVQGNQTNTFN